MATLNNAERPAPEPGAPSVPTQASLVARAARLARETDELRGLLSRVPLDDHQRVGVARALSAGATALRQAEGAAGVARTSQPPPAAPVTSAATDVHTSGFAQEIR